MRYSHIFGSTKRKVDESLTPAMGLLARAGFLRHAPGRIGLLPLGAMSVERLMDFVRAVLEVDDLWPVSGPTWPEGLWQAAASELSSYKQLPTWVLLRDAPAVPVRIVAFLPDEASADEAWTKVGALWSRIGETLLDGVLLEGEALFTAHDDMLSSAYFVPADGAGRWIECPKCGYRAEEDAARLRVVPLDPAPLAEPEMVETPGCTTIAAVAEYLGVPESQTLKAVFYADAEGQVVFAVIRGDLDVSPAKLERAVERGPLHPATAEELARAEMVPGYASPVGIPRGVLVVADESALAGQNFVAGANKPGYHLAGVNPGRDFKPHIWADIAAASAGDPCPRCGAATERRTGFLVGRVWRHSPDMAERAGMMFLNRDGKSVPLHVVSTELLLLPLLAAIAHMHHDDAGLAWPPEVAPFQVHLVTVKQKDQRVRETAEGLYRRLEGAGVSVLYDDRNASPGVKFADADLIGMSLRLTVSPRSLKQGGVEVKPRSGGEARVVPPEDVDSVNQRMIESAKRAGPRESYR